MATKISRRNALRAGLGAVVASSVAGSSLLAACGGDSDSKTTASKEDVQALVIGSGFGGAIASLRLAQAGIQTVVLERGRRWPITPEGNTFATFREPDRRAWWLRDETVFESIVGQPNKKIEKYTGVLEAKAEDGIVILRAAGVGGGSLVFNAIQYQPRKEDFVKIFPKEIDYDEMDRVYYPRVRLFTKPSPIPEDILNTPYYESTRAFIAQGKALGLTPRLYDVGVDWDIVREEIAGKRKPSAINGETWYGINSGAKNSLDRSYLAQAEATRKVEIWPHHLVTGFTQAPDGRWVVEVDQINEFGATVTKKTLRAVYLFLGAGSVGTSELLVRAKARGDLPQLNDEIGRTWGDSGDVFHIWQKGLPAKTNPTQGGPAAAVIEFPNNPDGPLAIENAPIHVVGEGTIFTLVIGVNKPLGSFSYDAASDSVKLTWPAEDPDAKMAQRSATTSFGILDKGNPIPPATGFCPHPLGGAVIGKATDLFGRVHGYKNLYVVDGALVPGSTGPTNPSLTIGALAERCMDSIIPEITGKAKKS
jgi:cholesterol oxidase